MKNSLVGILKIVFVIGLTLTFFNKAFAAEICTPDDWCDLSKEETDKLPSTNECEAGDASCVAETADSKDSVLELAGEECKDGTYCDYVID